MKPEPATLDRVHVLKVSLRPGILSRQPLSAVPQSDGRSVIPEAFFCYIRSKSLNIPAAIIKSNAVTKKQTNSKFGCSRPLINPDKSNCLKEAT